MKYLNIRSCHQPIFPIKNSGQVHLPRSFPPALGRLTWRHGQIGEPRPPLPARDRSPFPGAILPCILVSYAWGAYGEFECVPV